MVPGENILLVPLQNLDAEEEKSDYFVCNVWDMTSLKQPEENTRSFLKNPDTTVGQLVQNMAIEFLYYRNTVDFLYERKDGEVVSLGECLETTLEELNFTRSKDHPNNLMIKDKKDVTPKKLQIYSYKSGAGDTSATYVPPPAPPPYARTKFIGNSKFGNSDSCNSASKTETGFVGLVNQAMTCYLNSLLQTLYMTPEFRNALYRWEFDKSEDEGSKSIPYQLQKLFLLLQTSKKPAVGTTQLTTSFGWDSSEAWQQHDVQELCRVMFDALEKTFKDTEQSNLISTLYEGKLKDYVKCLECGHESAREDTFLDVPLVVRPFGSNEAYGSVEEALHAFVTPETLQDCNQYFCERCNKKCDAHKGLKFIKFPYLLTLQLKRFDFDYVTMHRIKLNDKVTFPEILNINEFMPGENSGGATNCGDSGIGTTDNVATDCVDACKLGPSLTSPTENHVADNEVIDAAVAALPDPTRTEEISTNEKVTSEPTPKGPYLYELFSIMVHSGSANGGHYYAYIKSLDDGDWYCFNDAQVTRITYDDIQKTYGGGPSRAYYSSAYSSSVNAYMLMYRQIDKAKNTEFMSTEVFPDHIKELLQNMLDQEEMERKQRELDRYMCKIKLFCQHPKEREMFDKKLKVHRDTTLAEATMTAWTIMRLKGIVPLECCRLVKYDDFHDSLESSFADEDRDEPIGDLLGGVKSSYKFDLLLEIKQPHEEFQVYTPGGTTVKIHTVNLEREEVAGVPIIVRANLSDTVEEFKNQVAKVLGANVELLRLVIEIYKDEVKVLDDLSATLKQVEFSKSNKVFAEFRDEEDFKKQFIWSKFKSTIDCHFHTITIQVGLPKIDKEILEKFKIPECDENGDVGSGEEDEAEDVKVSFPDSNRSSYTISTSAGKLRLMNKTMSKAEKSGIYFELLENDKSAVQTDASTCEPNKLPSTITPDDSSQECDEGLGDSEIGDSCSTSGCPSGHAVHSDQSEDSSLTDSERTLVGDELSPRNNSPDIMGTDIEIDADPGQALSPDTSRPDSDSAHSSSDSNFNFQADEQPDDITNPSSPEEMGKDGKSYTQTEPSSNVVVKRYFRAYPYTDSETGVKMLRVYIDKRMTLTALKIELEPFVGVGAKHFKIFRLYGNDQELECTRLTEVLTSFTDDTRLSVKLGRALRRGEYQVKIYQLCINDSEPCKYMLDCVFVKGMTVLSAKKEILPIIKDSCSMDIPINRCRLRAKSWKSPTTVFLDHQKFDKDIALNSYWELFLQVLEDAEPVTSADQLTVFLRRWHRSTFTIDKMQEVVLDTGNVECLLSKISEVSGIPKENIEYAKMSGQFPCEMPLLSIDNELDWLAASTFTLSTEIPSDDCYVVCYRDGRETLKELSKEEKRNIQSQDDARWNKVKKTSCSPRKEKALKIYTLDSSPKKTTTVSLLPREKNFHREKNSFYDLD